MGSSQVLSFLFLFLYYRYSLTVAGEEICPTATCGAGDTAPAIRFPFRLKRLQPETCGYPGFNLRCNKKNRTILEISSSGDFWVQSIDYINQEIWITDPSGCLARRLLTLDLWSSPFRSYYENYTMVGCTKEQTLYNVPFQPVDCLSNSTYEVWATASGMTVEMMLSRGCQVIATVGVPITWSGYYDAEFSFSNLSEDLKLTWDVPPCGDCEAEGGRCGFKSSSSLQVECSGVSQHGLARSIKYAVSIGIGVPALLCGIAIACYVGGRVKRYRRRTLNAVEAAGFSSTVNPQPTVVVMGLDNPTIESYPKEVLGESCPLPKPNDNTCSICLSEYQPRETLRIIPQCQHCFHADCIDVWLRMNSTCPLCRTSPTPI